MQCNSDILLLIVTNEIATTFMKINPQHLTQEVKKTPPPLRSKEEPVNPAAHTKESTNKNAEIEASRQRMLSWFSRVGITPSALSLDPKKQEHALERRKKILQIQKANNLKSILNKKKIEII